MHSTEMGIRSGRSTGASRRADHLPRRTVESARAPGDARARCSRLRSVVSEASRGWPVLESTPSARVRRVRVDGRRWDRTAGP
ncbi:hypothetical protein PtA15_2A141 [Puccinia triticina]|uniref:Uncharacterized protein n=1 Tax=Puccinia triticina TaxID=208348 RepID=A0ABY7C9X7_9BASI|nr:uncharacterized protein PtA15_2A141 [Puccinia triticina]WAQ81829.1 hypothetical protein PtA15_2A141 [Puccinia triticina]WAR52717.1 hypothetical protein PtB15_2B142 [Puccinia triticina]